MSDFQAKLKHHRRSVLENEWHQQSLENGFPVMQLIETRDVIKQVEDNADSFYTEDEIDKDARWIVERAQNLGLPGMPADLDTAWSCNCEDCVDDYINPQLDAAAARYAARQAAASVERTPQGEFVRFEEVQEVGDDNS